MSGEDAEQVPACTSQKRALNLVVPPVVPVGYPSGFYVDRNVPSYGYRGGAAILYFTASFEPAQLNGQLRHAYAHGHRNTYTHRYPLRFERGDRRARVTVTFVEERVHDECRRELSAYVRPQHVRNPHPRITSLHHRYWARFKSTKKRKCPCFFGRAWVRGKLRRPARRGIALEVYEGRGINQYRRIRPVGRRFSAVLTWEGSAAEAQGPVHARVLFPGDVRETWPCYDVLVADAPKPGCTLHTRMHRPTGGW